MEKKSLITCDVVNTAYTQPKAFVPPPTTVIAISAELSSELTAREIHEFQQDCYVGHGLLYVEPAQGQQLSSALKGVKQA